MLILTKKILLILLLVLWCSPAGALIQWCDDADIVACWNIETGSGETLVDQSSNSNDGTFKGAGEPAWDSTNTAEDATVTTFTGTSAWSIDFDGDDVNDDYITVADSASLDISGAAMSYVVWLMSVHTQTGDTGTIFNKSDDNAEAYRSHFDESVDDYRFRLFTNNGGVNCDTTGISFNANEWHHVSAYYDGSNMVIFFDGVQENSCGQTGNITTNNDLLKIGQFLTGLNPVFNGNMDELAIFDTNLDSTDFNDIMDNGLVQAPTLTGTLIR